ncbi:hypothetical protein ACWKWP_12885 [Agromyces soli]
MSYPPTPGAPVPGRLPHPYPPPPATGLPSAFGYADRQRGGFQALRWTTLGLAIAALLGLFGTLFSVAAGAIGGDFGSAVVLFLITLVLLFATLGTAIAMWASLSGAQRAFGDALTQAGYPGVDARRLYATRPVPTQYGFWLRSRRERRPDGTWLVVEPVAGGPSGPAPAAPRTI